MRVPILLLIIVAIVVLVIGFRLLVGRYFTLEGRALGAANVLAKATDKRDAAAQALGHLLGVELQPGDQIVQALIEAGDRWNTTVDPNLLPGDPIPQQLEKARLAYMTACMEMNDASDRHTTLSGPDPYGLRRTKRQQ
jgi:hypothetical protein